VDCRYPGRAQFASPLTIRSVLGKGAGCAALGDALVSYPDRGCLIGALATPPTHKSSSSFGLLA
jgi:hypothetical protein